MGRNPLASRSLLLDPANDRSYVGDISPDGSVMGYYTRASNILFEDTNGAWDVVTLPIFRPTIDSVSGDPLIIGQTTVLNFSGDFSANSALFVGGRGCQRCYYQPYADGNHC